MLLLMPCQLCGGDVEIELLPEGEHYRAPGLLLAMNGHVLSTHQQHEIET